MSVGQCATFHSDSSAPSCYDCDEAVVKLEVEKRTAPGRDPINTLEPNTGTKCTYGSASFGCLNSYQYDWSTTYPCGHYLLDYNTWGCCQGTPYSLSEDSCCYNPHTRTYSVKHSAHYCSCLKTGCNPGPGATPEPFLEEAVLESMKPTALLESLNNPLPEPPATSKTVLSTEPPTAPPAETLANRPAESPNAPVQAARPSSELEDTGSIFMLSIVMTFTTFVYYTI